jgi:hypothetical protein
MISYIISGSGKISAMVDNKNYVINQDHVSYKELKKAVLEQDIDTFLELVEVRSAFNTITQGAVTIDAEGNISFKGKPIHNALTVRMAELLEDGVSETGLQPWINFLNNLMLNPSKRATEELYTFLEHRDLPLTPDGHFLAYKRIHPLKVENGKQIYVDCFSHSIKQSVGDIVEVPRNSVDDNFGVECSQGLHVGSMAYVADFHSEDQVVIVKINPKDVVSVPVNEDARKCRVCKYEIVGLYNGVIDKPLISDDDDYWPSEDDDDDDMDYSYDYDDEDESEYV